MDERPILKAAILLLSVLVGVPAAIGWVWGKWQMHAHQECQKSRECREREAEAYRYVVDDGIRHASNYNDEMGE